MTFYHGLFIGLLISQVLSVTISQIIKYFKKDKGE